MFALEISEDNRHNKETRDEARGCRNENAKVFSE